MLLEMSIQRIALIEKMQLHLDNGFNVFTGETGAGKSILLDAIGLLAGNRASGDLIRTGFASAVVEALFQVQGSALMKAQALLTGWGFDGTAGEVLISRELHRSGRTVCRINGRLANVQMLRELGTLLVQQHGQHDQQGLLRPDEQLRLLDLFGKHQALLDDVRSCYAAWSAAKDAYRHAEVDEQERIRRLDMLAFQINEIQSAKLRIGEEEELREQRKRLQFAEKITESVQLAVDTLQGTGRGTGVQSLLAIAEDQVSAAAEHDAVLGDTIQMLDIARVNVEEAGHTLAKYLSLLERDPSLLQAADERFAQIRALERKYGQTVGNVLEHLAKAKSQQKDLEAYEQQLAVLEHAEAQTRKRLVELCMRLHRSRVAVARQLAPEVQKVLRELSMPSAAVQISVEERKSGNGEPAIGPDGMDVVTFLFSANKGEDLKPLQKIASGGELSRTLLALKAVLAEVDDLETLIFDEIDAGLSGAAAQRAAEQLQKLGRAHQVLCVTHSAQIAAAGRYHFCIEKEERQHDTLTRVHLLDRQGRISEIARLVGADVADDTAMRHAVALLDNYKEAPVKL